MNYMFTINGVSISISHKNTKSPEDKCHTKWIFLHWYFKTTENKTGYKKNSTNLGKSLCKMKSKDWVKNQIFTSEIALKYSTYMKHVCVCCWPPVRGVFLNYEVLEFQLRIVTPPEPRICQLLLRIYTCPTRPPLPTPDVLLGGAPPPCPNTPSTNLSRVYAQDHTPTWASTVSISEYQCYLPHPYPSLSMPPPLQPSLAPSIPVIFQSPPNPCRWRNCFNRELQLILRCLLNPPQHTESPPSLVTRISFTKAKNRPQGHPLRHCCLLPVHICTEWLCPCSL